MQDKVRVPQGCGYRVTPKGLSAMDSAERCECNRVLQREHLVCEYCGTLYGNVSVRGWAPPRKGWDKK